jgi:hypothetical protein
VARVKRSLYARGVGYNYEAVKIFMPPNREKPVIMRRHGGHLLAEDRDPQHWRDSQQLEHVLGEYLISDKPVTEEEWARERATVIDAEPAFGRRCGLFAISQRREIRIPPGVLG